jgi:hypothetical protein
VTNGSHRKISEAIIVGPPHPSVLRNPPQFREVPITDLIERADRYVSIEKGAAKLNPAIQEVMTAAEIAMVEYLVNLHNSESARHFRASVKEGPVRPAPTPDTDTGSTSEALGSPPAPCVPHVSIRFFWWGFRINMDHCFCSLINPAAAGIGVTVGAIAAIMQAAGLAVAANPYLGLAAALILTMVAWISWADSYCVPNSGANYNQSWTVQGWITTVC